ncbi:hypothetical protein J6590_079323 [Homalodisca vitripennis]|nr:hypothetical protein J6590_079323 [Homalodisca vitripennis]
MSSLLSSTIHSPGTGEAPSDILIQFQHDVRDYFEEWFAGRCMGAVGQFTDHQGHPINSTFLVRCEKTIQKEFVSRFVAAAEDIRDSSA